MNIGGWSVFFSNIFYFINLTSERNKLATSYIYSHNRNDFLLIVVSELPHRYKTKKYYSINSSQNTFSANFAMQTLSFLAMLKYISDSPNLNSNRNKIMKRSLIALSVLAAASQSSVAAPFAPMDARGMAMGNTGVASARMAGAPYYNPALLAAPRAQDDFQMILPSIGLNIEGQFAETAKDMNENLNENDYKTFNESLIEHFETITNGIDNNLSNINNNLTQLTSLANKANLTPADVTSITNNANQLKTGTTNLTANTGDLKTTTDDLNAELNRINGESLRGMLGSNPVAIAVPSKNLAIAISTSLNATLSGRLTYSNQDQATLQNIVGAVDDFAQLTTSLSDAALAISACGADAGCIATAKQNFENASAELTSFQSDGGVIQTDDQGNVTFNGNQDLTSSAQMAGIVVFDAGLSFAREFNIKGHDVAIGVTPKLQKITTIDYIAAADQEFDSDDLEDSKKEESTINIDLGASYQFGENKQFQTGVVIKNLLSKTYKTALGTKIHQDAQVRGAISHSTSWSTVAIDLDLLENKPVAFEDPTQFIGIGGELDAFGFAQLRAGYRMNIADTSQTQTTVGAGFWLFGPRLDFAISTSAINVIDDITSGKDAEDIDLSEEISFALQLGMEF